MYLIRNKEIPIVNSDSRTLLPMGEAARRLGISRVTMSNLAKSGRFTIYQDLRDRRVKLVDLEEVESALAPRPMSVEMKPTKKAAA